MAFPRTCIVLTLVLVNYLYTVDTTAAYSVKNCEQMVKESEDTRSLHRNRRHAESTKYDEILRSDPFPENINSSTVLYDFNALSLHNEAASSFRFNVITAADSLPRYDGLFVVDDSRQLRLGPSLSSAERKKYFDYEQYPTIVVIINATRDLDKEGLNSKLIKLTIPLKDVNDEIPVVKNQPVPYLAAVPQEPDPGHTVYVLLAEDPDTDSDLEYIIPDEAGADIKNFFFVDPVAEGTGTERIVEGQIKILRRTRFTLGSSYLIPVTIRDRKQPVTQVVTVEVNVTVGPRPPQFFQQKYEGWIFETKSTNNPVFALNSNEKLFVQVHQFQQNHPKTFRILDESNRESTLFRIDEHGHIYNKDVLDFDVQQTQRPPKFRFQIRVIETSDTGELTQTVPLDIVLKDENDNPPRFQLTQYLKTIREDLEIGKTVLSVVAEDSDSGNNSLVTYELENPYFEIKKVGKEGVITVKETLDFDAFPGPTYRFIVHAKDSGIPALSSSVDVTVTTSNVNDEPPNIIPPGTLVLRDMVPENFILTRLRATDGDGDNVKFYFTPREERYKIFNIKPSSGIIQVVGDVPPNIDSYTLNISAVDDGSCCGGTVQLESKASFIVEIVDSVNQKPFFKDCLDYSQKAAFNEESEPGTPVIQVVATDPDRGLNGAIDYSIESPSTALADAPFDIDRTTGQITVKSKVNRETLDKDFIQVTVKGSDKAQPPQEGWCTFRVAVQDINDNSPVFNSLSYSEKISSNAQVNRVILRVGATDRDIGDNAKIAYSMVEDGGGIFGIYKENGLIFLKSPLAASRTEYNLLVKAQDNGSPPKEATVRVKIEVATETSEPPKFEPDPTSPNYSYKIAETVIPNTQEAIITTLTCRSNMQNPRVQYFLVDSRGVLQSQQAGAFAITEYQQNGLFKVDVSVAQQLDYEKTRQYSLILRCQNFGGLTMYEQITLTIDVEDRNNKVPYFEGMDSNGRYAGSVPENTGAGAAVIEVQGYDDDVREEFRNIRFKLSDESYPGVTNDFEIKNLAGNKAAIITKREFDREKNPRYFLTVTADDISPSDRINHRPPGTPNTASVVVQVDITDKNDNPMTFKQPLYNHTVAETASIGTVIFAVTADDIDEVDQGRLKYSFINSDEIPFDIRDQTGEIIVVGLLDYESHQKDYSLILESRDSDNFYSATTTIAIYVTDENDNLPVFGRSEYVIENKVVEEDTSVSKENPMELITVTATDADISRTTNMRYRLLGEGTEPGDRQLFTINEKTGQVFLVAALDRDEPNGKSEYIFTVEALDEDEDPQKGYTNIKVKPLDINDNKPIFDVDRLTGEVYEHSPPGWFCPIRDHCPVIAVVITNDFDFMENASVDYEIVSSPSTNSHSPTTNFFNIDPEGRIFSQVDQQYLDRETRPKLEVVIRAKDRGPEPQTSTATVTIIIKDINDNSPVFTQRVYNVTMSEHFKEGIVTEVHATDRDENDNAELQFSMSERVAAGGHFKVDTIENKGAISIYQPVDYETLTNPVFELEVRVRDKNPSHFDTAIVRITVEDFNDNAPKFTDEFISVTVEENNEPGELLAKFHAQDLDSGINAEFSYYIDRESDPRHEFMIDPVTGVVRTRKKLDREVESKLTIRIKAVDKGDPKLTGTASLDVTVSDVNDNFPVFKEDYRPVVYENMRDGENGITFPIKVLEVFAIDKDTAIYGPPFGFVLPSPCLAPACDEFSLSFNEAGDSDRGTALISTSSMFDRERQKFFELPIVMWDMRGTGSSRAQTGTNTLTIIIGDVNDNPHYPGHQEVFVYNYKGLFGPLVVGRVFVEDLDDWDLSDKTFTFASPASMKNFFMVDESTGDITMKKGVKANFGEEPYQFTVDVFDRQFQKTVTSTVSVVVKDLPEEAVLNSGAVRLQGMTAERFIMEPKDPRTGKRTDSLYTQFRLLLSRKLGYTSINNVEIVTLLDRKDYLEIRYAAHASPYMSSAQVDSAVILNMEEFGNLGIKIMPLPIDECQDEVFEGGCYNRLEVTGSPVTVSANGTSFVGVEAYVVATEGCEANIFSQHEECTGDYCYNGGTCNVDNWGTVSCACSDEFDGPRCQQRRHHFDGNSVAMYRSLQQCENSQTSIEFMTKQEDGVLLYNGPLGEFDPLESPQDFIFLELRGGYPVLIIDHGTGATTLALDGKDNHGNQLLQKLNDGRWHHIDINRSGKVVGMVVDKCTDAMDQNHFVTDDRACRTQKETPGENIFLNVNTHLHLGGILTSSRLSHLGGRSYVGFTGCIRNLVHNKKLYDLHFKPMPGLNTGQNGCPPEDSLCEKGRLAPKCGAHGICEATLNGVSTCRCKPMWFGSRCNKPATVRDFDRNSYYLWGMKDVLFNTLRMTRNRDLDVQMMFRTRQLTGILIDLSDYSSTESTLHIRLVLNDGKVRLVYNMGDGERYLDLTHAQANNGQWHVLRMERHGHEFHLQLDGGEGRNYNYTLASDSHRERDVFVVGRRVYSGAYKQGIGLSSVLTDDLIN
ncbi:unnamed protein product, partial [Candidula unifasciata]